MSVRREFDYDYDEVADLRHDLEELAAQARANASSSESFTAALERRLASHAPRASAVRTGGAAAREAPSQLSKDTDDSNSLIDEDDDSNSSVVEGDDVSVEEADDKEGGDDKLSASEIDAIRLKVEDINDEMETTVRAHHVCECRV